MGAERQCWSQLVLRSVEGASPKTSCLILQDLSICSKISPFLYILPPQWPTWPSLAHSFASASQVIRYLPCPAPLDPFLTQLEHHFQHDRDYGFPLIKGSHCSYNKSQAFQALKWHHLPYFSDVLPCRLSYPKSSNPLSFCFLEFPKPSPATGPLHMLVSLPGRLFSCLYLVKSPLEILLSVRVVCLDPLN